MLQGLLQLDEASHLQVRRLGKVIQFARTHLDELILLHVHYKEDYRLLAMLQGAEALQSGQLVAKSLDWRGIERSVVGPNQMPQ